MFETPPPKTITSGSKILITFARPIPKFSRNSFFHCLAFSPDRSCTIDCNGSFFPVISNQRFSITGQLIYVSTHPCFPQKHSFPFGCNV